MKRNIKRNKDFKYHYGCKKLKITHLCFADDLLVFCHGDFKYVSTIKEALEEFSSYSGLKANMNKSNVFFGGLTTGEQSIILSVIPFSTGRLPVRYLGVPLLTKKICAKDWFPWCQGELTKGKAKVSWDSICKPKELGGLGIKDLNLWNEVLLVKQLWNVISKKNTLWVKWVILENLKGKIIWEVEAKANSSVEWKKILKLRDKVRKHVLWKIRDGNFVNSWYDNWNKAGPINGIFTPREIYDPGMKIDTIVAELSVIGDGEWPEGWENEYLILNLYKIPRLQEGKVDEIV
ncbi:RNA-directed DNA polymerase, eukaryota, reverse transcriptase zinc-binding domain protein [Tanacetum coccineum]